MNQVYVLKYTDDRFVQRDDSTGPLSSGGYPYPVHTLDEATKWDTAEDAAHYAQTSGWDDLQLFVFPMKVMLREMEPIPYPPKGQWTKCNHHCVESPESTGPDTMHYLDCPVWKKRLG